MWGDIVIAFLLAFITAYVITPYTMRLARKVGAIDMPSSRRINKKPMPRLGGLAVISGFILSVFYLLASMVIEGGFGLSEHLIKLIGFFVGIFILGITCFIDDCKSINPFFKLLGQVLAALVVTASGINIENFDIPFLNSIIQSHPWTSYLITIGWIVGITNAINLTDGLDGLSSGITLISCISLLMIFSLNGSTLLSIILITALAGAITGFLPYNFNPAKTYIGDVGSNFLGFALAVISILGVAKTYTAIVIIAPIITLGLPIFDTLFAIVRRVYKGKSLKAIFQPDRGHLHHRLMDRGYTQKEAVFLLYGLTATLGVFAIILLESGIWKAVSFGLMILAICAIGYKDVIAKRDNNIEVQDADLSKSDINEIKKDDK